MKILANKDIRNLFLAVSVIWAASLLLAQGFLWLRYQRLSLCLLFIFLLAAAAIWVVCCSYFKKQNKIMPVILRLFGSIFFFPAFQQTQVIAQHPKTFLLCLPVSHFLADFSFDDCLSWRTMTFAVKTDREILCQLQGSFLTAQSKEAGSEINHISVPLTGKAMEPPVHLHAGMSVIHRITDCKVTVLNHHLLRNLPVFPNRCGPLGSHPLVSGRCQVLDNIFHK